MLVLTRKLEEQIRIGDDITISILRVKGNTVRVGIEAPRAIRVVRGELPTHDSGQASTSITATRNANRSERSSTDGGSLPGEAEFSEPATTAVRQFLATRARRQKNLAAQSQRTAATEVAPTLTRSA